MSARTSILVQTVILIPNVIECCKLLYIVNIVIVIKINIVTLIKNALKPRYIDTIRLINFRCESVWKIF